MCQCSLPNHQRSNHDINAAIHPDCSLLLLIRFSVFNLRNKWWLLVCSKIKMKKWCGMRKRFRNFLWKCGLVRSGDSKHTLNQHVSLGYFFMTPSLWRNKVGRAILLFLGLEVKWLWYFKHLIFFILFFLDARVLLWRDAFTGGQITLMTCLLEFFLNATWSCLIYG